MFIGVLVSSLSALAAETVLPYERVLAWAAKHNYELNPKLSFVRSVDPETQKVEVSCRNSEPLVGDEIILRVPAKNLLTDRVTVFDDCAELGGEILCDTLRQLTDHPKFLEHGGLSVLTIYIAFSRKLNKGEFAEVLVNYPSPSDVNANETVTLYYDDDRVELVAIFGQKLYNRVLVDRSLANRLHNFLPEVLRAVVTEEELRWAFYLVNSRCFWVGNLTGVGDNAIAIIPLADYLNHHPSHIVTHREESPETSNVFTWRTVFPYADPGMEVYGYYGELSNAHLATKYGFSLPVNPANTVALELVDAQGITHELHLQTDCWLEGGDSLLSVAASTGQTGHAWDLLISAMQAKLDQYNFALRDPATSARLTPLLRSVYENSELHLQACMEPVALRKTAWGGQDPSTFEGKAYEDSDFVWQLRQQHLTYLLHEHRARNVLPQEQPAPHTEL